MVVESSFVFLFQPELDILLSIGEPLLTESQLESGNIVSVTLGSLYSPPETWTPAHATGFTYIAALNLPLSSEVGLNLPPTVQPCSITVALHFVVV